MSDAESSGPASEGLGDKKADETWKEKALREKEKLSEETAAQEEYQLPPPSFLGIVDELSARVMLSLGQIMNPNTGEVYLDLDAAKYAIDLLAVLEEKTKGNLDATELATLREVLHNLRLLFVHVARNPKLRDGMASGGLGAEAPSGESRIIGGGGGRSGGGPGVGPGAAGPGPGGASPGPRIIL